MVAILSVATAPATVTAQQSSQLLQISQGTTLIEDGDTIFFGSAEVGDTAGVALTLRNVGNVALTFTTQVPLVGPAANDFTLGELPPQVAPGGFGIFGMNFSPNSNGTRTAFITISSNDPLQPNVNLTLMGIGALPITDCNGNGTDDATDIANGTATDCDGDGTPDTCQTDSDGDGTIDACEPQGEPAMSIEFETTQFEDGDTIFFGSSFVGDTIPLSLTIRNNGDGPLTFNPQVEKVGPAANDFVLGNLPTEVQPGGFGVFGMNFTPSAAGIRQTLITIRSNDPIQPDVTFTLSGIGATPITDCNGNSVDDGDELASGIGADCNGNGVLDECELDSDGDGTIDACEQQAPPVEPEQPEDPVQPEDPTQPEPPVDNPPVDEQDPEAGDEDLNEDEEPMPVIEEDPFGDEQDAEQEIDEQIPVSGFCGAGTAMNMPMMMLGLFATGMGRRWFAGSRMEQR